MASLYRPGTNQLNNNKDIQRSMFISPTSILHFIMAFCLGFSACYTLFFAHIDMAPSTSRLPLVNTLEGNPSSNFRIMSNQLRGLQQSQTAQKSDIEAVLLNISNISLRLGKMEQMKQQNDHAVDKSRVNTTVSSRTSCPPTGSIRCCQHSIQNPPGKIDIVVPYKYRKETDISLQYELRSFEKSGLLDHVGTVFIVADSRDDVDLIETRYRNYFANIKERQVASQLRIIAADDIQVPFSFPEFETMLGGKPGPGLIKQYYFPYLPSLSPYYIQLPDDVVMLREYKQQIWFDMKRKLPYAHSFGTANGGVSTRGFPNIAEMHGPSFLNKCSMRYVIEKYNITRPRELSPTAVAIGMMNKEKLLAGFYGYNSNKFAQTNPHKARYFKECHTNGACKKPSAVWNEIFVNIQGQGVSIEYPKSTDQMMSMWSGWFKKQFPTPSRFEM